MSAWDEESPLWKRIEELMRAPEGEIELFEELEGKPPKAGVTAEVMHWVLFDALRTPGPLIDGAAVRVALGLDPDSFDNVKVSEWLSDTRYEGALQAFEERWWGRPVRMKLAEAAGGARPLDASARAKALTGQLGVELRHEGCSWCGGERTLQACHACRRATDAAHSVRPLSRPLPAWADSWVVCYACIAEGKAEGISFPQSAQDIVQALIEGNVQPPSE